MNLMVATIYGSSKPKEKGMPLLLHSAKAHGVDLKIFEVDFPYSGNYMNKIVKLRRALKDLQEKPEYVLFVDAFDTMLTCHPSKALEALDYYKSDFVIGAETACWPWPKRFGNLFPKCESGMRYPNSGVWLGSYEAVLRELRRAEHVSCSLEKNYQENAITIRASDQLGFQTSILIPGHQIAVDREMKLVANFSHAKPEYLKPPFPPVIHWSGDAGRSLQKWVYGGVVV